MFTFGGEGTWEGCKDVKSKTKRKVFLVKNNRMEPGA